MKKICSSKNELQVRNWQNDCCSFPHGVNGFKWPKQFCRTLVLTYWTGSVLVCSKTVCPKIKEELMGLSTVKLKSQNIELLVKGCAG